jgi:hypothetical protein
MNKAPKSRITDRTITARNGQVLTSADFDRMALEAETTEPDFEAIAARSKGGRPALGDGISPVLQIRLDALTRQKLAERASQRHTTPSQLAREAIQTYLANA